MAKELVWVAPFDLSGISQAARWYVKAIDEYTDLKLKFVERASYMSYRFPELMKEDFNRILRLQSTEVSTDAPIFHEMVIHQYRKIPLGVNIGVALFETEVLPPSKIGYCNAMDGILVPSDFCFNAFERGGVKPPMKKLPIPINTEVYSGDVGTYQELQKKAAGRYIFMAAGVMGWRKGLDVLLKAFTSTFTPEDPVVLALKIFGTEAYVKTIVEQINAQLKQLSPLRTYSNILAIAKFMNEQEMPALYNTADCLVLPTRGEGWGMPLSEAMCLGKPTIATRWGGQLEFMTDENSYLINVDSLVTVNDRALLSVDPSFIGQKMAEPSKRHLSDLMLHVLNNRDEAKKKGEIARKDIISNYSLEVIAGQITQIVEEL